MTTAEPLRSVRDHLSDVVDRVQRHHERVIITRNGHDAAYDRGDVLRGVDAVRRLQRD